MPSALTNIIKCLMICKTKLHIHSKCSNCCEVDIDFEEGPKSLSNSREVSTSNELSEKINESRKNSKVKIKQEGKNAGSITTDL